MPRDAAPLEFAVGTGTFIGGGSTYYYAIGLAKLGRGRLMPLEIDLAHYEASIDLRSQRLPLFRPHLELPLCGTPALFEPLLRQTGSAEFMRLHGAENAKHSLAQFHSNTTWLRPGSVLVMHDQKTENAPRPPFLPHPPQWREPLVLDESHSIGFRRYEMI